MKLIAISLLLLGAALAAEAPSLTPAEENSILKAENEAAAISDQVKDMQQQFTQLQLQQQQLQIRFPQVQAQLADAQKKVDAAIDAAYKAHNLDKSKTDFDKATLKFKEKAEVKK